MDLGITGLGQWICKALGDLRWLGRMGVQVGLGTAMESWVTVWRCWKLLKTGEVVELCLWKEKTNPVFCFMPLYFTWCGKGCSLLGEELIPIPPKAIRDIWAHPLCPWPHERHGWNPPTFGATKGWEGRREMMKSNLIKDNLAVYHHMSAHLPITGLLRSLRQCHLRQRWPRCASLTCGSLGRWKGKS